MFFRYRIKSCSKEHTVEIPPKRTPNKWHCCSSPLRVLFSPAVLGITSALTLPQMMLSCLAVVLPMVCISYPFVQYLAFHNHPFSLSLVCYLWLNYNLLSFTPELAIFCLYLTNFNGFFPHEWPIIFNLFMLHLPGWWSSLLLSISQLESYEMEWLQEIHNKAEHLISPMP